MPSSSQNPLPAVTGWEAFDPDTSAFYHVSILDIKLGQVLCNFQPNWKNCWVASSNVRRSPSSTDTCAKFDVGQQVEVKAQAGDNQPCGWFKGVIKSVKNNCALIHFVGFEDSFDDIFEFAHIRQESLEKSIDLTYIKRVDLTLTPSLKKSPSLPQPESPDMTHVPIFASVLNRSGVMSVSYNVAEHKIVVVGTDSSLTIARPLIEMAVAHQTQLHQIQNRTELAKQQLRIAKEKAEHSFIEEFPVSPSLFGLVIGQNGSRINSVQNMPGVSSANIDTQTGIVRIVGDTPEAVRIARAALEFIEMDVPIAPELAGWVRGKGNKTIQQLEQMSKAHHIRIMDNPEKGSCAVHIAGTKDAVQSARLLIEQHIEYRSEWDKADQEQKQILQQLYEVRRGQQRSTDVSVKEETNPEGESPQSQSGSAAPAVYSQEKGTEKRRGRKSKWVSKKKEGQKTPPRANYRKEQIENEVPGTSPPESSNVTSKQQSHDGLVAKVEVEECGQ